jgi:hypothetical protein
MNDKSMESSVIVALLYQDVCQTQLCFNISHRSIIFAKFEMQARIETIETSNYIVPTYLKEQVYGKNVSE